MSVKQDKKKVDSPNVEPSLNNEDSELQQAILMSMKQDEKKGHSIVVQPKNFEDDEIEKAVALSIEESIPQNDKQPFIEDPDYMEELYDNESQYSYKDPSPYDSPEYKTHSDETPIPHEVFEERYKIAEKQRLQIERRIDREEQDNAYMTSVLIDRHKEQVKKEEEKKKKDKEEQEKREQLQKLENEKKLEEDRAREAIEREIYLKNLASKLPEEPHPSDETLLLTFQLPNGERVPRLFLKSDTVQTIKDFIDTRALYGKPIPKSYKLITDYPKKIWDNMDMKLSETNWTRELLRVEQSD